MRNKRAIFTQCVIIFLSCLLVGGIVYKVVKPTLTNTQEYKVSGSSMYLPLTDGDVVEVDLDTENLKRFDIVVFKQVYEGKPTTMIKRIIGVPQESVMYKKGELFINDVYTKEPYVSGFSYLTQDFKGETSESCYFLMGDNRRHSIDSREFGCIKHENIIGVVRELESVE